jgi:hypothetical protein
MLKRTSKKAMKHLYVSEERIYNGLMEALKKRKNFFLFILLVFVVEIVHFPIGKMNSRLNRKFVRKVNLKSIISIEPDCERRAQEPASTLRQPNIVTFFVYFETFSAIFTS